MAIILSLMKSVFPLLHTIAPSILSVRNCVFLQVMIIICCCLDRGIEQEGCIVTRRKKIETTLKGMEWYMCNFGKGKELGWSLNYSGKQF